MEDAVRQLFERYERLFNHALRGDMDAQALASLYATDFIAASPAGVHSGKNDARLKEVMAQGYDRYRAIGTKEMRIRHIGTSPIDELHAIAHVAWTATYARRGGPDVTIDFDVHYLVQILGGEAKVFGWVSGDEEALLKEHGIVQDSAGAA
ncbi:MAG: nuclear transport factor 2 family protein [Pseudomonadota bacterium]